MAKGKKISEVSLADKLVGDELIPFAKNGANGAAEAETIKEYVTDGLDGKYVAKEDGKGLSSNDFTDEDKAKLDRFELVLANDDEIEDGLHQIASSEAYRNELKERGYVVYHDVKFKVKDCGVTSDSFPWIVTEGAIITANEEGELSDHTQKNVARSVYIWFDTILHYQPYGSFIPSKVSELQNDLKYQTEAQLSNSLAILYESLDSQLVDEYTHLDNKKVDKVEGKSLSTNDYTDEDKAKLDGMEVNYLPKTGGTVEGGANSIPLKVDSTQDTTAIQFQKGGESKGNVGWNSTWGSVLFNYPSGKVIGVKDDGTPHFDGKKLMYANGTTTQFVKADGSLDSTEYVAKETGKQLSTEDFTTALKQKLEGLTNYDDAVLDAKIEALKDRLDTLVGSGDVTAVIDTFQEIEDFLQGVTNTQTLTGLLQEMKSEIVALCADTYLPKDGDAIKTYNESKGFKVKRNHTTAASTIEYGNNTESLGQIGVGGTSSTYPYEPTFVNKEGSVRKLLHSGLGTSSQFLKADGSVDGTAYWSPNNDGSGSGLDADTVDGYQTSTSGSDDCIPVIKEKTLITPGVAFNQITAKLINTAGWYRIASFGDGIVVGANCILNITRSYNTLNNETYSLSISKAYGNRVNIVQLNSIINTQVISKIRVLSLLGKITYIDLYYNVSESKNNAIYISGIGDNFIPLTPTASDEIPEGYSTTEFELGKGFTTKTINNIPVDQIQRAKYVYYSTITDEVNADTISTPNSLIGAGPIGGFKYVDTKFYNSVSDTANRCQVAYGYTVDEIYFRRYYNGWNDWRQIAFIDSNVASANKLTTKQLTNEDLNDIKEVGKFFNGYGGNTCVNKPSGINPFSLSVISCGVTDIGQIIVSSSNNKSMYYRIFNGDDATWSDWKKMLTEDDIAPLITRIAALEARPTIASVDSLPSTPNNNTLYAIPE